MQPDRNRTYVSHEDITTPPFENKWLNLLFRTHVAIPVSVFVLYASGLLYFVSNNTTQTVPTRVALVLAGFFTFTFVEYLMHRFVYHMKTSTPARAVFQYKTHGVHHAYPKSRQFLAMPPTLSLVIATILLGLFRLVLGQYCFAFLAGFLLGYATYMVIHFSVHIFRPPNRFFRRWWINHAIHHYRAQPSMFGVTSAFWDHVFGTTPKSAVTHSAAVTQSANVNIEDRS